jgi:response regulator RpfG family c-di-GMP phosphodiesterase
VNKKPVIVLVEDEPLELVLLTQILQHNSEYEIHQALNIRQAYEICERVTPDIIISDYNMPGGNGYEFCNKIKNDPVQKKAFFIMLSGINQVDTIIDSLHIGADDYLTKPYHAEELRSRVDAFVRIKTLQNIVEENNVHLVKLNQDLDESFRSVIELLSDLMELRVPNASYRSNRAKSIVGWLGTKLDIPKEQIDHLHFAALLHEIGKVSLPDVLLNTNINELSKEQRVELDNFPIRGQLLMQDIPLLRPVAPILRHQMENFDGTGYPDRLQREEIPLGSRILRIINAVEMAFQNSPCTIQQLEDELMLKKGIFFDPQLLILIVDYLNTNENASETENLVRISVPELLPGMKIARSLFTSSGKKLLAKDAVITEKNINHISTYHQKDPILVGIYVYKNS